ncbi:hypothetical protein [Pseudomonas kilonensis]|uniref:hypothetical protein n=1 Tax=Pseudomonas kilonensis TaxID=132476 RepID=UPI00209F8E1A|nr:hypothetical protein [Pseudomonas kilonensis]MCP1453436.1 hypothetical protein [Pseudomonas kilonensis]
MPDTYSAHDHANRNQAEILISNDCACFGCYAVFPASDVTRFTETTAWCPKCEAFSTVVGDASELPLDREFLEAVHDHWIGPQDWLDEMAAQTHAIATAVYTQTSTTMDEERVRPWWKFWR